VKDYYKTLFVLPSATQSEISKAFKRLAKQYHPDKNPDPGAEEVFKEVLEAYETLSDPQKRSDYDFRRNNPIVVEYAQPKHRDPAYRRPYRPAQPKVNAQLEMMKKCLPFFKQVMRVAVLMCLVLLVDWLLPSRYTEFTIVDFEMSGSRRSPALYLTTEAGKSFKVTGNDITFFSEGDVIRTQESKVFSILKKIEIPAKGVAVTNLNTLYRNYFFVPTLLLIFSILSLVVKAKVEFHFNLGIVTLFVLLLTVFLILK